MRLRFGAFLEHEKGTLPTYITAGLASYK